MSSATARSPLPTLNAFVALVGGALLVESAEGGTTILARIPLGQPPEGIGRED